MTADDPLTVDDIVSDPVAADIGEGRIPVAAVLVIETMSEAGPGLRFVVSEGTSTWHALGMLRSASLRLESEDGDGWEGE